ncbi:MAG TPA: hypothetical protein VIW29_15095 [Polyangiaceae bacterium]
MLALGLGAAPARADLGDDLERVERALGATEGQHVARLPPRLLERDQPSALALPPWALDPSRGECTTLVLLAPVPTQFVVRFHPWPGLPPALASSAGGLQVTRCGTQRIALLEVGIEMRSPRAVMHTLVAIGSARPAPLEQALPTRDTGPAAFISDGPPAARLPLAERLRRFELAARRDGAFAQGTQQLRTGRTEPLTLGVGCHRLFASGAEPGAYRLLLRDAAEREPTRLAPPESGELSQELCIVRERPFTVELEAPTEGAVVTLASARFALPSGLPGRFGPLVGERLSEALGATSAPSRLGVLVSSTIGAQGRTRLPRALPTGTCYLAAVTLLHGEASSMSIGVAAGAWSGQASSSSEVPGTRLSFCTDHSGQVDLDVEARGLGVAWLLLLFRAGPAEVQP